MEKYKDMELMEEAMQDMVFGRWRMALPEK